MQMNLGNSIERLNHELNDANIQFTVCPSLNCADFDCFSEITHNCEISIQEKEKYISIIKFFTQDANIDSGEMVVHDLPLKILFTKTHIDTL